MWPMVQITVECEAVDRRDIHTEDDLPIKQISSILRHILASFSSPAFNVLV